jgi:hypothetical protein
VDDVKVHGNPYVATFPKDGSTHHVRGEARGYAGESEDVVANADGAVNMSLNTRGGLVGVTATTDTTHTATTATAPATTTGRPVRPIDTSNPYAPH